MAEPDAGVVESAAQRALCIPEILEMIFDYLTFPSRHSRPHITASTAPAAPCSAYPDLSVRGTNSLWKFVVDRRLCRTMNGHENAMAIENLPVSYLPIYAGMADSLHQCYRISAARAEVLPYMSICLAVNSQTLVALTLDLPNLTALAGFYATVPYLEFVSLSCVLLVIKTDKFEDVDQAAVDQVVSFLGSLSHIRGLSFWTDCPQQLEGASSQTMHWVSQLLRGIPGTMLQVLNLDLEWDGKISAEDLALSTEHYSTMTSLIIHTHSTRNLIDLLAILADPLNLPNLQVIPQVSLVARELAHPADLPSRTDVTSAMVNQAIEGLKGRAGLKDGNHDFTAYYNLVNVEEEGS